MDDTKIKNEKSKVFQSFYNPLKLPLGWDNKPIPYWLYKLHGLNQSFLCEICGNFNYHGRQYHYNCFRAFDKHFSESRHIQGLRILGIPNSKLMFEITSINKAIQLYKYIESRKKINNNN